MKKRTVYHILEWILAAAGCAFLAWKLATYDDYASLCESLRGMDGWQWSALVICVLLMPVNMLIEAWRWRTLIMHNEEGTMGNLSFAEAQRQVYYSKLAGLVTPWRLGEYPARGLLMMEGLDSPAERKQVMAKALSMGAVGSATMTVAIILAGLVSILVQALTGNLSLAEEVGANYWIIVGAVLLLLVVALAFAPRLLRRWTDVSHRLIVWNTFQSLVRLLCWCVQLILVLWALGAVTGYGLPVTGYGIPVYYLLVTITPNVPIAEAGVRGAWAIVVFGSVNAALAGVILWGVNTLLPCLIWPFLRKNTK